MAISARNAPVLGTVLRNAVYGASMLIALGCMNSTISHITVPSVTTKRVAEVRICSSPFCAYQKVDATIEYIS